MLLQVANPPFSGGQGESTKAIEASRRRQRATRRGGREKKEVPQTGGGRKRRRPREPGDGRKTIIKRGPGGHGDFTTFARFETRFPVESSGQITSKVVKSPRARGARHRSSHPRRGGRPPALLSFLPPPPLLSLLPPPPLLGFTPPVYVASRSFSYKPTSLSLHVSQPLSVCMPDSAPASGGDPFPLPRLGRKPPCFTGTP